MKISKEWIALLGGFLSSLLPVGVVNYRNGTGSSSEGGLGSHSTQNVSQAPRFEEAGVNRDKVLDEGSNTIWVRKSISAKNSSMNSDEALVYSRVSEVSNQGCYRIYGRVSSSAFKYLDSEGKISIKKEILEVLNNPENGFKGRWVYNPDNSWLLRILHMALDNGLQKYLTSLVNGDWSPIERACRLSSSELTEVKWGSESQIMSFVNYLILDKYSIDSWFPDFKYEVKKDPTQFQGQSQEGRET